MKKNWKKVNLKIIEGSNPSSEEEEGKEVEEGKEEDDETNEEAEKEKQVILLVNVKIDWETVGLEYSEYSQLLSRGKIPPGKENF